MDARDRALAKTKGGMAVEDMAMNIANLGFPIAVSVYLLVRIEGKLDSLADSINDLSRVIAGIK